MLKAIGVSFVLFLFFSLSSGTASLAQEDRESSIGQIKDAFVKAMQDLEAEKAQKEKEVAAELKMKLEAELRQWITAARQDRSAELNKLTHRDWKELNRFVSPVPYDYYLRDFNYSVAQSDIVKTDSLIMRYRAQAEVIEVLYIERYHASGASDIKDYLDTIIRPIKISFEYADERFVVTDVAVGEISIERGWQRK